MGELAEGATGLGSPHADPLLAGWPDPNTGWPTLNTTYTGKNRLKVTADGSVLMLGVGRRTITTTNAHQQMVLWVAELTGMSVIDAYQFVSQTALTPVANVVDTAYTVVAKVAKAHLPGVVAMDGVHARLRKQAGAWAG